MKAKFTFTQILVVACFVCVLVVLVFANKKVVKKQESAQNKQSHEHNHFDFWSLADSVNATLDAKTQAFIKENGGLAQNGDLQAMDTLIKVYSVNKQPIFVCLWKQKRAEKTNLAKDWAETGTHFYVSSQFFPNYKMDLLDNAIHSLEKALKLDSTNLDTKVKLGVCFVESNTQPMQGITLLKEVLEVDSNNLDANLNLGLFAIQSGQYDKAIDRFNKILLINPKYIEAYIYLGQTFANMGNKKQAIEVLEKYKRLNKDELINEQVNKYINELKTS